MTTSISEAARDHHGHLATATRRRYAARPAPAEATAPAELLAEAARQARRSISPAAVHCVVQLTAAAAFLAAVRPERAWSRADPYARSGSRSALDRRQAHDTQASGVGAPASAAAAADRPAASVALPTRTASGFQMSAPEP